MGVFKVWNGAAWEEASLGYGALVDDTSPQLGGNLDLNGFIISDLVPQTVADATDTLASGDARRLTLYSSASAVTVTVPTSTFAAGDWFLLQSTGALGLSLSTAGITLNGSSPSVGVAQNEALLVIFTAADTVSVLGGTV